jgi:hypothetical protein
MNQDHTAEVERLRRQQESERERERKILREIEDRTRQKQSELDSFDLTRGKLTASQEAELARLKLEHEAAVHALRRSQEQEMNQLRAEHEASRRTIRDDIDSIRQAVDEENRRKMADFRKSGEEELANLQKQHAAKVAELKAAHKREVDQLRKSYRSKVEGMRKKHEEKIKAIQIRAEQHLASQRQKAEQLVQTAVLPERDISARRNGLVEKQAECDTELAQLTATHRAIIAEKKASLQQELLRLQMEHAKLVESAQTECDSEIRSHVLRMERRKGQLRPTRDDGFRALVITRIASIPPQSKQKKRRRGLMVSRAQSVSIVWPPANAWLLHAFVISRARVVFSQPPLGRRGRSEGLSLSTTERKRGAFPPIETLEIPDPESDDSFHDIGNGSRRSNGNRRASVDSTSRRVMSHMHDGFGELADDCRDMRGFVQAQRRGLNQAETDVRQQSLELARAFRETVADIEHIHQSALAALSSIQPPLAGSQAEQDLGPRSRVRRRKADVR